MDLFPDLLCSREAENGDEDSLDLELTMANVDNGPWLSSLQDDVRLPVVVLSAVDSQQSARYQHLIDHLDLFKNSEEADGCSDNSSSLHSGDGSGSLPASPSGSPFPPTPPASTVPRSVRNHASGPRRRAGSNSRGSRGSRGECGSGNEEGAHGLSKNAIAARENRIKKKQYVSGLERSVRHLSGENRRLTTLNEDLSERADTLATEVAYLRGVLANVDEIATLVRSIKGGAPELALGCGVAGKLAVKPEPVTTTVAPAGVCLHVNSKKVSLEFCPRCSANAATTWQESTE